MTDFMNAIHACVQHAKTVKGASENDLVVYIRREAYEGCARQDAVRFSMRFEHVWEVYQKNVALCGVEVLFIEDSAQHPYVAIVGQQSTTWGIGILPAGSFKQFERMVEVHQW